MEEISNTNLDNGLFALKFHADWCAPCKRMEPIFSKLEEEFNKIKFISVNTEENKDILKKYNVRSIPVLILIKDGVEFNRINGVTLIDPLRTMFKEFIKE